MKEELKPLQSIKYANFRIKLQTEKLKYKKPKNKMETCILKNRTYAIQIYAPLQLKYKNHYIVN